MEKLSTHQSQSTRDSAHVQEGDFSASVKLFKNTNTFFKSGFLSSLCPIYHLLNVRDVKLWKHEPPI